MPLHGQHEMIGRSSLDCFNDSILRTACHDPQPVSYDFRRLVMAGVDRDDECSELLLLGAPGSSRAA